MSSRYGLGNYLLFYEIIYCLCHQDYDQYTLLILFGNIISQDLCISYFFISIMIKIDGQYRNLRIEPIDGPIFDGKSFLENFHHRGSNTICF